MKRRSLLAVLCATALAVGCSHKPARDVREAETELTSARQDRAAARSQLEARQSQERYEATRRGASPAELEDMNARHQRELAELEASTQSNVSAAAQENAEAHQKMARERAETRTKLETRLAELDGKANDAHARSAAYDPAKKSAFDKAWLRYTAEHRDVEGALRALSTAPDAEWPTWRDRTGQQLDELEKAVDALRSPE